MLVLAQKCLNSNMWVLYLWGMLGGGIKLHLVSSEYSFDTAAPLGGLRSTDDGLGLVERLNRMLQYEDSLDAHAKHASSAAPFSGKVNQWVAGRA